MPELPDVEVYVRAIAARTLGRPLRGLRVASPFVLRTVEPPAAAFTGRAVTGVRRIGKRIALAFEGDLHAVVHLMISGRLHWKPAGVRLAGRAALAAFDFDEGSLTLTEAATRKRASLHLVLGEAAVLAMDAGGVDPTGCSDEEFAEALRRENHTVKRALTDPRLFSGIGNAFSDEILHRARLSPAALTQRLDDQRVAALRVACREVLVEWTERLAAQVGDGFPEKVTAFRPEMAVHGKYDQACPACGSRVQRIIYAENECNYCATCQTGGRLLSDRSLARLLREDWPRTLQELEEMRASHGARKRKLS